MTINSRAYAFILQEKNEVWQLLVFKIKGASETNPYHVPGGGIDAGETPLEGVLREIEEESGLIGLEPKNYIGQWIRVEHEIVFQRHYFLFHVPNTLPDRWDHVVTGDGQDAGIVYQYKWILPHEALRLHLLYHAFLNARHLPDFFADHFFLGLNDRMLYLMPYSDRWPYIFAAEADILKQGIGEEHIDCIEHIGSTAVWGMAAKPIIDIAIGVHSTLIVPQIIEPLRLRGYEYKGPNGVPGRHYFKKQNGTVTTFHIHLYHKDSRNLKLHIKFRDELRHSPKLADNYLFTKLQLWVQNLKDGRKSYTEGKVPFFNKFIRSLDKF